MIVKAYGIVAIFAKVMYNRLVLKLKFPNRFNVLSFFEGGMKNAYAVLEKELKSLPESYLEDVVRYVKLSLGKGLLKVPEDIHFGDDDIREMFEEYV